MVSLIVGSGHGDAPGGRGVTGVAPDARVLFYEGDNPLCDEGDIATMLDDAVDQGADIISMSMGLLFDSDLKRAVQRAMDAGVVVVAAAGNFETNIYPATFPGVVAVGAVDQFAQLWNGTPRDATAAVAAPGVWVAHGGVAPSGSWVSEYYGTGTSASTAITAGALALVKSKYPDATGNQLIQQLIHTPAGDDGYDWQAGYGFGIVNVTKMLATSPTQWPDDNPLLVSPQRTLKEYPMWASSRIADPPGHDESTAGKAPHEATPTPGEPAAAGAGPGDGMPGWLWAVVGAAVVAAAGSTAFAARRGRGRQSIDHTKRQGV
jgi:hypothetical protein